jgi:hypothetical protein
MQILQFKYHLAYLCCMDPIDRGSLDDFIEHRTSCLQDILHKKGRRLQ